MKTPSRKSRNYLWRKHREKFSENTGISKKLLFICVKIPMKGVNVAVVKVLQNFKKLPKSWMALQLFHNYYLDRQITFYVNTLATYCGIFKFQKWPLQGVLHNSYSMNRYKLLKKTCSNLWIKLQSIAGNKVIL